MKWVVAAIVAFVVLYTAVNYFYRKPGPGYRPYQDAQDRATTARLLNAGWQKIPVELRRPVEKPDTGHATAPVTRAAAGLGPELEGKFAERPKLPASIDRVVAPTTVTRGSSYGAYFTATLSDQRLQAGELTLYRHGNELVFVPESESLPGAELRSRWPDDTYWVGFATTGLPAGRYEARIVAKGPAAAWSFEIR